MGELSFYIAFFDSFEYLGEYVDGIDGGDGGEFLFGLGVGFGFGFGFGLERRWTVISMVSRRRVVRGRV